MDELQPTSNWLLPAIDHWRIESFRHLKWGCCATWHPHPFKRYSVAEMSYMIPKPQLPWCRQVKNLEYSLKSSTETFQVSMFCSSWLLYPCFFFSLSSVERFCGLTEVHLNFEPWLGYKCGRYIYIYTHLNIHIISLRWTSVDAPSTVPIELWSTCPRITVSYTQSAHSLALRCHEGCRRGLAIEIPLGKEVNHEGIIWTMTGVWPV